MHRLAIFYSFIFLITACNKGLTPPEQPLFTNGFPIQPQGGNPVGDWIPDPVNPVTLTILDESQIPAVVDSLIIDTELDGAFSFSVAGVCSVQALLTLKPSVYLLGTPIPFTITINDTISGKGPFRVAEDIILVLPVRSTHFNFDTLGFTASQNRIDLISLPNIFDYEGIIQIPVFFVFHLVLPTETQLGKSNASFVLYRKKEDLR
ncbi:MAG: hypothetical protein ABIL68_09595 [bacterium]